jgi:hypothetical protein
MALRITSIADLKDNPSAAHGALCQSLVGASYAFAGARARVKAKKGITDILFQLEKLALEAAHISMDSELAKHYRARHDELKSILEVNNLDTMNDKAVLSLLENVEQAEQAYFELASTKGGK